VFANDGEDVAEVIASHYLEAYRAAGDDPDAEQLRVETVQALRRSARRAETVGAPEAAAQAYLKAAELSVDELERLELTEDAGRMTVRGGYPAAALELLEPVAEAHRAAGRARESVRTVLEVVRSLTNLGRNAEAAERLNAALAELGSSEPGAEEANLNAHLGNVFVSTAEYTRALPVLETALELSEALMLPDVLSRALCNKGIAFLSTGRPEEARALLAAAVDVAERSEIGEERHRALGNLANLEMQWDLPAAGERWDAALAWARRRGDRRMTGNSAGNVMTSQTFTGSWQAACDLAAEVLSGSEEQAGSEYIHNPLANILMKRGEVAEARASHERSAAWEKSDDVELRAIHLSTKVSLLLAEGSPQEALKLGESLLPTAIETLGASNDAVRQAWPDALRAALDLGQLERARALIELLEQRPPGHVPPYLSAQLASGRGLIAAAEQRDAETEQLLREALALFDELRYSYWQALARIDLAEWLVGQDRGGEAEPLVEQAILTLRELGAAPALTRAEELRAGTSAAAQAATATG
jgi:tetratricopeptide (TPR) repeat protein